MDQLDVIKKLSEAILKEAKKNLGTKMRDRGISNKGDSDDYIWKEALYIDVDREDAVDAVINNLIAASRGPSQP
jgi:hypothetical protein